MERCLTLQVVYSVVPVRRRGESSTCTYHQSDGCLVCCVGEPAVWSRPILEYCCRTIIICQEPGHGDTIKVPHWSTEKAVETEFMDANRIRAFRWVTEVLVADHVRVSVILKEAKP